ncbi:hypothetical protein M2650_03345 [Luteimonas sp. SX5]|uniref:SH3 domain-containing protein n=1 Tax=Luteimonas galliterrae TaxID=2940486 RepID=A0ABT0MFP2_9GAMM|nr:hypothetical protein [Luteimonas galliterrae]MCL1633680.1 hypothetical protein [Luteimonas galliterrae]
MNASLRILLCALALSCAGSVAAAERADCAALAATADGEPDFRPPLQAKVTGKGRLHFHNAPSAACRQKIFVIPGDALTVYKPYQGWVQVMYVSRAGKDFTGWVEEKRLAIEGAYGQDPAAAELPKDVVAFISRRDDCEHFLGEEPYDAERREYLAKTVRELCTGSNEELAALRGKYRNNEAVIQALSGYERIAE